MVGSALAPAGARAPRPRGRTARGARAARPGRPPEPVGAQHQRLGQPVLQRRRSLDEHELARLPVRLARPQRPDDGRQAAAEPVDPGALGACVRLPSPQPAGAPGADGRRRRRAPVRPGAPAVRTRGGVRRGVRARDHSGHRRRVSPQQPRRTARAVLRRGAVVRGPRARDRSDQVARAQRHRRRARLRDEDGRCADGRAGDRRAGEGEPGGLPGGWRRRGCGWRQWPAVGGSRSGSCSRVVSRWPSSGSPGRCSCG